MNEQKKRLKIILNHFEGNQTEFGKTIGKSKQTVSGWLSGRFPIPEDAAITIEMVHGFRREWTLRGENPERIPKPGFQSKLNKHELNSEVLKKISTNKVLKELIETLSDLPKKEFEIARRLISSLTKDT
ncbi:transcriptional regulator [Leptospira sp. 201903071]|uniref:transcriptional regulator n=1 Tax=Leptospira ainazelensis TaxID=2810034 RepID=UPI00196304D1|nr:transcriptional regulator [Leptospira ainazelensis]MBM9500564.1 transcriptional regulator [Leptospira ainazelensis]